jgi:hypothetical protein
LEHDAIHFGDQLSISFQRTIRVPDDGQRYPLPPGLGPLPLRPLPAGVTRSPGCDLCAIVPLYQREALWLVFLGERARPVAVKIALGLVNAVTGERATEGLHQDPQDYLVCPYQPWLDGIPHQRGVVRQFVAMPLGEAYTVEEQLRTGKPMGGIRLVVYSARPDRLPKNQREAPPPPSGAEALLGLGAGGQIDQKVYPDPYGLNVWDTDGEARASVAIVNSEQYPALTGEEPPPTPVSPRTYADAGLPWFALYDEAESALEGPERLHSIRSVDEVARARGGRDLPPDESLDTQDLPIRPLLKDDDR